MPETRQRLDRWLFFSRAVKSRSLAQKLIAAGAVRVNSERTQASDRRIGAGDVLTMTMHEQLRVWRVLDPGSRRGPAAEAALLSSTARIQGARAQLLPLVRLGGTIGTSSAGIDNLFDREPERVGAGQVQNIAAVNGGGQTVLNGSGSTFPAYYDVLGRRYFVNLRMRF